MQLQLARWGSANFDLQKGKSSAELGPCGSFKGKKYQAPQWADGARIILRQRARKPEAQELRCGLCARIEPSALAELTL